MKHLKFKKYIFIFLVPFFINGQVHTHQWLNYTNGQNVNSLASYNNYIWASTNGGLVRYNTITGISDFFNKGNANLPVNESNSIVCDTNGTVWSYVGNRCVFSFDGNTCTEYTAQNSSIPSLQITGLAVDNDNNVWLTSYAGLIKYSNGNFILYDTSNSNLPTFNLFGVTVDDQNTIWLATPDSGLVRFNGSTFQCYKTSNSGINSNYIYSVCASDTGVWMATGNGTVMKFDGVNWIPYNSNNGFSINWPNSIYREKNNTVWFSSFMGLMKLSGGQFTLLTSANSPLVNDIINCAVTDNAGNLFAANGLSASNPFPSNGLYHITATQASKIKTSNSTLPSNIVYSQFIDKYHRIWFGTYEGIAMFDGVNWFAFDSLNQSLPQKCVYAIAVDGNDNVWLGTYGGLIKCDGNLITVYDSSNTNIITNKVIEITVHDDTAIWIGTFGDGLMQVNEFGPWIEYNTKNSPLTCDSVRVIRFDAKGSLWAGTEGGGLLQIDTAGNWSIYKGSVLLNDFITGIDIDTLDRKWISTYNFAGGISVFNDTVWTHWDIQNSQIPTYDIKTVKWSANGTVYASAGGCTYACVMPFGLFEMDIATENWTVHNLLNSGIGSLDVVKLDGDLNGNIWMATSDGVSVINNGPFVTGINTNNQSTSLQIFPNPANSAVVLRLPFANQKEYAQLMIFSTDGKVAYSQMIQQSPFQNEVTIDLPSTLANGIYILRFSNSSATFSCKLIIKK